MISRIPNPKFVWCKDCSYRKSRKRFVGKSVIREGYCNLSGVKLHGRKGCEQGQRKIKMDQETLE